MKNGEVITIPDEIGVVEGYRGWVLDTDGYLRPTYQNGYPWAPAENRALCYKNLQRGALETEYALGNDDDGNLAWVPITTGFPRHTAIPDPGCDCGFWLLKYATNLWDRFGDNHLYHAFGVVEGYGRVVQAKEGWRVEKARIKYLILPIYAMAEEDRDGTYASYLQMLRAAARRYDVEVKRENALDLVIQAKLNRAAATVTNPYHYATNYYRMRDQTLTADQIQKDIEKLRDGFTKHLENIEKKRKAIEKLTSKKASPDAVAEAKRIIELAKERTLLRDEQTRKRYGIKW